MKQTMFVLLCCLAYSFLRAQSFKGVTGKPDTSYTSWSAYFNTLKTNPEIRLVLPIQTGKVAEHHNITYCSNGKRNLLLDLFSPRTKIKGMAPAVIIIHGGGWRSGNRTQHYPLAQTLAARGYICVTPEYRLSTEALYPAAVIDLRSAIRWVKENSKLYHIDTNKIALLGFSAGGELAAFLATTAESFGENPIGCITGHNVDVNALVDLDGTLSFVHEESGEGDDTRSTSAATYWFGYSKKENYKLWKDASPLTHVGMQSPPTLFINSSVDRMHAGREDYIKVLQQYHIYNETHAFEKAPHSFPFFEPWFTPMVNYIDNFLKKVMK